MSDVSAHDTSASALKINTKTQPVLSSSRNTSHGSSHAVLNAAYSAKQSKWWTDHEEAKVRRKLDTRIVVVSFSLYLVALLDRSNIGNSKTAGMDKQLHISDSQFQWLLTIFYLAYVVFQFQVLAYKILRPRVWITFCVFVWGVAGVCQSAATSWTGMMIARLFLGISEAGYGTGVALYMSFFYPKTEIGLRFGIYVASGAISAAIAGSIAYGLVNAHTALASWRLLFLIEGVPTLLMAPIAYFLLPDSIESATFLSDRERMLAEARLFRPPPAPPQTLSAALSMRARLREQVDWQQAVTAFRDPMSYISAMLFFIINVGYSSIPVYLPTLISQMGYGSIRAQGLSAPPYVLAFIVSLLACWLTDKYQIRGPVCTMLLIVGATGYLMLATLRSTTGRYVAVWLVVNGLFPFIPLLYMWLMSNQASESKRGLGLVIFATIGQCGPLLGAHLFPAGEAPYYVKGTATSGALLLLGVLVCAATSMRFWLINKRRDVQQGTMPQVEDRFDEFGGKTESQELALVKAELQNRQLDVLVHGEDSPYFRYTI